MNSAEDRGLRYRRVLVWALAAVWLLALVVALGPGGALQALCGVPLVLVLPGLVLSYALVPPSSEVAGALRVVLALGLSLVATLAGGLFLALCFDEVSRGGAALGLAIVATLAGGLAWRKAEEGERVVLAEVRLPVPVAVVTGLLLVACAAIGIAALNVSNLPGHYTALTVSPSSTGARVEVRSHEGHATSYRYVVRDQNERSLRSGTIELDGGETRSFDFAVPRSTHAISVALYTDANQPYRQVTLRGLN